MAKSTLSKFQALIRDANGNVEWREIEASTMATANTAAVALAGENGVVLGVKRKLSVESLASKKADLVSLGTALRQLGKVLETGMNVVAAMDAISSGQPVAIKRLFSRWRDSIANGGVSVSEAINENPGGLSNVVIHTIRAGEESGKLTNALSRCGTRIVDGIKRKKQVMALLREPTIFFIIIVAVVIGTSIATGPSLAQISAISGTHQNAWTQSMLNFSDFLINDWTYIVLVVVALVIGWIVATVSSSEFVLFLSKTSLRIPLLGEILETALTIDFLETLNDFLLSAVPLGEMIPLLISSTGSKWWEHCLNENRERFLAGEQLGIVLAETSIFPLVCASSFRSSGETGVMDSSQIELLIAYYKDKLQEVVDKTKTTIPTVTVIIMSMVAAWFLIATTLPLMQMLNFFSGPGG